MVTLDGFDLMAPGIAPVSIHLKGHMPRDRTLAEGSD